MLKIADVLSPLKPFDFAFLKKDTDKYASTVSHRVAAAKERALIIKKAQNPTYNNPYVYDGDILECVSFTEEDFVRIIFQKEVLNIWNQNINGRYMSWQLSNKMRDVISFNNMGESVWKFSENLVFRSHTIYDGLIPQSLLEESIKNGEMQSIVADVSLVSYILDLVDASLAEKFLEIENTKIKIQAYKKIGIHSNLEKMIGDAHADVRIYAVACLPPKDQRLERLINDRSSRVFLQVAKKIDKNKLPLLLGSSHLKNKAIKKIINERISS